MKNKIHEIIAKPTKSSTSAPLGFKSTVSVPGRAKETIQTILDNIGYNPRTLSHQDAIRLLEKIKVILQDLITTKNVEEESKYPIFENVSGNTFKLK
jgi:hypothetical protein